MTLRERWPELNSAEQRDALGIAVDCAALRGSREGSHELIVFAAGHGPGDLPRRGFRTAPVIKPLDWPPANTGVVRIHVSSQQAASCTTR